MPKFKVGETVAVSANCDYNGSHLIGKQYKITRINNDGTYELPGTGMSRWREDEIEKVREKMSTKTKFYRVVKDHPAFEVGAILQREEGDDSYSPVSDVFVKEIKDVDLSDFAEDATLVEGQAEWFEKVYPIGKLEKMLFGNRKQAQAAMSAGAYKAKPEKK